MKPSILAIDFETTGLDPLTHEPIQVGAALVRPDWTVAHKFATLIRPVRLDVISLEAMGVHQIGLDVLGGAPEAAHVLAALVDWSRLAEGPVTITGWNVAFDLGFLEALERAHQLKVARRADGPVWDLMNVRKALKRKGLVANQRLGTVAAHFGIEFQAHDALADILATVAIGARALKGHPDLIPIWLTDCPF